MSIVKKLNTEKTNINISYNIGNISYGEYYLNNSPKSVTTLKINNKEEIIRHVSTNFPFFCNNGCFAYVLFFVDIKSHLGDIIIKVLTNGGVKIEYN